jgi:hypothetical protein
MSTFPVDLRVEVVYSGASKPSGPFSELELPDEPGEKPDGLDWSEEFDSFEPEVAPLVVFPVLFANDGRWGSLKRITS